MPDYNTGDQRKPRPPRGPGDGPLAKRHTSRLYPEDRAKAVKVANLRGISFNEVVRRAIRLYYKTVKASDGGKG